MCNFRTMTWSANKIFNCHENHPIFQSMSSTTPTKLKEDIKRRINSDMQSTPSVLLTYQWEHDLSLKSKQTHNMKDKNLGETNKRISEMNDISDVVTHSKQLLRVIHACSRKINQFLPHTKFSTVYQCIYPPPPDTHTNWYRTFAAHQWCGPWYLQHNYSNKFKQ